jgi:uncharacterized protein YfbU (UPF0304 family)
MLSESLAKPTVLNYISAILWKLRQDSSDISTQLQTQYQQYAIQLKEEIERDRIGKEFHLTQKESKSFVFWEDIQNMYSTVSASFDRSNYNSFLNFVILSLYILHPPVRADYANMKVFIDDSLVPYDFSGNYCVLQTNPRFVFQQYKTAKHNGVTVVPIDPELHDILLDWMDINHSEFLLASFLIYSQSYRPFSESTLCKRVTAIFLQHIQKPVTINTLRHSFISFMSQNDQEYITKQNNASKMMHSVSMADKYRRMVYLQ